MTAAAPTIPTPADLPAPSASPGHADPAATILNEAHRRDASHVHVEQSEGGLRVRMRLGGRLRDVLRLDNPTLPDFADHGVDVARMATPFGERLVLHLPEREARFAAIEALGMPPRLAQAVGGALAGTGLILISGPAGAGKRRTLKALVDQADDGTRNILSAGSLDELRGVLRQDPDVIAIDSVADRDLARLMVLAADAHLVIATIEARDAVSGLQRLRDFRVEPFQLASTLHGVIAQRLVRRLCQSCREPVQARGSVSSLLGFDAGAVVYAPVGCDACDQGFSGETGVFEAILADPALRRLINDGGDGAIIARHAFLNAPNLGSAARALVREGRITAHEAVRLSRS
ncbi:ATPase, T2SS/T4P/T4SS family [Sphingomonas sp. HF-S3]|uniref:ATPase, T2SS/T4P/T4SS family n=1 Tax=Sphingomonas rustica TaxID=3103142 RepID=A0ABV0B3R7_9SPHN